MPMNLVKYGLALISMAIIAYFSVWLVLKKLRQAGILKPLKFKKKIEEPPGD